MLATLVLLFLFTLFADKLIGFFVIFASAFLVVLVTAVLGNLFVE